MASYRGHIAGATAFGVGYVGLLGYVYSINAAYQQFGPMELVAYPVACVALAVMFGLWPDVDTNSKGQKFFYGLFLIVDLFLIVTEHYREAAYLGLFALLPALSKHRGWTHTWWAMVIIPAPLVILPYMLMPEQPFVGLPFYGAAVVGYFSHLVMDGLVVRTRRRRRSSS